MNVFRSKTFEKSLKKILSGGKISVKEIEQTIEMLALDEKLPLALRDHALKGELQGYRECHIRPDVLLIYRKDQGRLLLILVNIGSHSELFT